MNVLIVGAGTQGKFIAQTLSNDSNNVTVVDYDPKLRNYYLLRAMNLTL